MAQPTRRLADVDAVGELVEGDFWVKNPWRYPPDKNLSAFEPNRVYFNTGGLTFMDVTHVSDAASKGDGRGALAGDIDGDLAPDLIVRHAGGGSLVVYLNRLPRTNRLTVVLRGKTSNALGIGARVVAEAGGRTLTRDVFPHNTHTVQQPARARFGLGDATKVDTLTVHWPSGKVQRLRDVPANQVLVVAEE